MLPARRETPTASLLAASIALFCTLSSASLSVFFCAFSAAFSRASSLSRSFLAFVAIFFLARSSAMSANFLTAWSYARCALAACAL